MMQPILTIDLTSGSRGSLSVPAVWEKKYLGGAVLGARMLYSSLTPELDPLSPEAPLLFLTGPLTGTFGPAVGRFVVCGKSPVTRLWAESNCGGFWGPELRFCGYDGLWISGKAERPVYLWIHDGEVEIRDAGEVWGKDTYEAQDLIRREVANEKAKVLTIGPAGENGVKFAGLFCDHGRTAGRTGLGAVAGAKNLKAIAVRGSGTIPLARRDEFSKLRGEANRALKADNVTQVTHDLGTAGVADYADYLGSMPKKYYQRGALEDVGNISGATMAETILTGVSACHGCVIACGRVVNLGDGVKRKGPEYETAVGFGPNLMITDLASVVRLNERCDRLGMDTISASNTIGLAFHLFEMGRICAEEVGFALMWGDEKAVENLLGMTARREEIGKWLAEGSRALARQFGAEEEAVQVNGLEVAYHDPRGVSGMALVYATSPRGACHNKSDYFFVDWGQAESSLGLEYLDRHAGGVKAKNVARHQDWRSLCDALVLCFFSNVSPELINQLVNEACGFDLSFQEMLAIGERGWTLKRMINNRMGLKREHDTLPAALLKAYEDGPVAGYVVPFDEMMAAYYASREWDPESGYPTRKKVEELGLYGFEGDGW